MTVVAEVLSHPLVGVVLVLSILLLIRRAAFAKQKYPKDVPWVGRSSKGYFANIRSNIASLNASIDLLVEGYKKYGKQGKAYLMPQITGSPTLILPRSQMKWALELPDDVLSTREAHSDILGGDYAFPHKSILRDPYHEHVIYKCLPRRLQNLLPEMEDEIAHVFDSMWGLDETEWRNVRVYEFAQYLTSHLVNRMLVGLPLCRDDDFLKQSRRYPKLVVFTSFLISLVPKLLRPILAPILALPNSICYRRTAKHSLPIIAERRAKFDSKIRDPEYKWEPPNDFISWCMMVADAEGRFDESNSDMVARRLMPIEFAAIHTSSITTAQLVLDLVSSKFAADSLERIRAEAQHALEAHDRKWTKEGLAECKHADSAVRESMRVSNFLSRNTVRKVICPSGITSPQEGWHAPQGTTIAFDMHNVQHDPDIYHDPDLFNPLRFVGSNNDQDLDSKTHATLTVAPATHDSSSPAGIINTSDTWFPFSHGRHACPGRFFVAAGVKMILAYMTINYNVEPLKERPGSIQIGQSFLPPSDATIRIRRRKLSIS